MEHGGVGEYSGALPEFERMIKSRLCGLFVLVALTLLSCSWVPGPLKITPSQYLIRRGDTLFGIAWRYNLEMKTLASWNGIHPPYVIRPGQRLNLRPPPGYRKPTTGIPTHVSPQVATRPAIPRSEPKKTASITKPTVSKSPSAGVYPRNEQVVWGWPTAGKVVAEFSAKGVGKTGINIQGKNGQPVLAAASGKVVYSGNGLKGYGELVIVKHSEGLLSAYAYNRKRLVKEGSWVHKGQQIAELGGTGKDLSLLHFEIRKKGKPVNPLSYLPRR